MSPALVQPDSLALFASVTKQLRDGLFFLTGRWGGGSGGLGSIFCSTKFFSHHDIFIACVIIFTTSKIKIMIAERTPLISVF